MTRKHSIDLPDEAATAALAARLAPLLQPRDVVVLYGDLGAGKTSFVRALIGALGGAEDVPSPTFTLVQTYDLAVATLWHFDLYRLSGADEVVELGWDEALADGIAVVEWPDRLGPLLPPDRLAIDLRFGSTADSRRAVLTGHGGWAGRLDALAGPW